MYIFTPMLRYLHRIGTFASCVVLVLHWKGILGTSYDGLVTYCLAYLWIAEFVVAGIGLVVLPIVAYANGSMKDALRLGQYSKVLESGEKLAATKMPGRLAIWFWTLYAVAEIIACAVSGHAYTAILLTVGLFYGRAVGAILHSMFKEMKETVEAAKAGEGSALQTAVAAVVAKRKSA